MRRGQPLVCSRSDPGPVRGGGGAARRKAPLSGQALPRWQYGVWAILALRALLPAGLLGRTLVPGGRAVLEAARLQVELPCPPPSPTPTA
ncbi:MAG: hypothetical protein ACLRNQ_02130 [Flavonifractor plautii]